MDSDRNRKLMRWQPTPTENIPVAPAEPVSHPTVEWVLLVALVLLWAALLGWGVVVLAGVSNR